MSERIVIPPPVAVVRADHTDDFNPGTCNVLVVTSIRWRGGSDGSRMNDQAEHAAKALAAKFPGAAVWYGSMYGKATESPYREWEGSPFAGIDARAVRVYPEADE